MRIKFVVEDYEDIDNNDYGDDYDNDGDNVGKDGGCSGG